MRNSQLSCLAAFWVFLLLVSPARSAAEPWYFGTVYGSSRCTLAANTKTVSAFTLTQRAYVWEMVIYVYTNDPTVKLRGVMYRPTGSGPGELIATTEEGYANGGAQYLLFENHAIIPLDPGTYYLGVITSKSFVTWCNNRVGTNYYNADTYTDGPTLQFSADAPPLNFGKQIPVNAQYDTVFPCDDGDSCTMDTWTSTVCRHDPVPIDDGNPCTVDMCDSATGAVSHEPAPIGASCSDDNYCNGFETCDGAGTCISGVPPLVNDGNPCTADSCDPLTGVWNEPVAPETSCSDGNRCNGEEICDANAVCVAGIPPPADDGNPCTIDACEPAVGVTHTPVATGSSCSDGNACNGLELCDGGGNCLPGAALVVDDGSPCTIDSCDPQLGVLHTPMPVGTSCSDGNACNGPESCGPSGACLAGIAPQVDDGNPCTVDLCDPIAGVSHVPVAAGTSCSDGNVCNGVEVCGIGGTCVAGTPLNLDDGDACTVDSCDPVLGVLHSQLPGCLDLPPDPATVAPPLSATAFTSFADATAFLYTASNPVQRGVEPGAIDASRAAVLRGLVTDAFSIPIPGALVSVLRHPELGTTRTRGDGRYDLVVNGGGGVTIEFSSSGYLTAQRRWSPAGRTTPSCRTWSSPRPIPT